MSNKPSLINYLKKKKLKFGFQQNCSRQKINYTVRLFIKHTNTGYSSLQLFVSEKVFHILSVCANIKGKFFYQPENNKHEDNDIRMK